MCLRTYKDVRPSVVKNSKCGKDTHVYQKETCYINYGSVIHKLTLQLLKRMRQPDESRLGDKEKIVKHSSMVAFILTKRFTQSRTVSWALGTLLSVRIEASKALPLRCLYLPCPTCPTGLCLESFPSERRRGGGGWLRTGRKPFLPFDVDSLFTKRHKRGKLY